LVRADRTKQEILRQLQRLQRQALNFFKIDSPDYSGFFIPIFAS